ncbi:CbtA family protein [Roseovarius sp. M141]|uniref:CbtA family protein n=1 Tax=Roseovarius sp. M141 TaxID=2583806 RepID=UPI0020CCD328|nr:CbtA family protein [Roseovarius sp. M141]
MLHAELYERGELLHFGADPVTAHPVLPGFDAVRDGLSVIFTMLTYTGYGLLLLAMMSVAEGRGAQIDGRMGMIWGIAGFVTFHPAPAFTLAPEVPGVAAAEVGARQVWWFCHGRVGGGGAVAACVCAQLGASGSGRGLAGSTSFDRRARAGQL